MTQHHVIYLLDPLCGWCYGAAPRLEQLRREPGLTVSLMPTGMFAREGARSVTADWREHVWHSDQRIQALTGQPFSAAYHDKVVEQSTRFDSFAATLALIAARHDADHQWDVLHVLQRGRYVDGVDNGTSAGVVAILERAGFAQEAQEVAKPDEALLREYEEQVRRAQALMDKHRLRGVPTLLTAGGPLPAELLFGAGYAQLRAALLQD
ncbi:DsbA family protein [Enterobacillus tribolii]|uniref:DSBA-like thioredoxin domain-containing protein n=1 Tax=Enterobacillus tribolii TaxID=1487935 RepID=A0A370R367_9GAMM|nr:DsbA family protein [Enterobacillus tribolii]MBW7983916.1 DsbA family protein [Enterobacillus tribolii]RDK96853.1 putative protein-disulfide isomerase [Enterobacillus tribolii]